MASMKRKFTLSLLGIILALTVTAQINSGIGYMHGTNKKGDTATKSVYDADKAKHESGADTVVIKRTPTPASEARVEALSEKSTGELKGVSDTSMTTSEAASESSDKLTSVSTGAATADCPDVNMLYYIIGFLSLLVLILLVLMVRRGLKDHDKSKKM